MAMTFADFSIRLALGQLKNTTFVDELVRGTIRADYQADVLEYTKQGLTDLCTRIPILTRQVDLTFVDGTNSYEIDSAGLASFLSDTDTETFEGFMSVMEIIDSEGCIHLPDTDGHIVTSSYNTLRFSTAKIQDLGEKVRIRYKAEHPEITLASTINIPPLLENALQLFVASLSLVHMGGEVHAREGEKYWGAYLRMLNVDTENNQSSTSELVADFRFGDRGFV